ncbi:MAG: hypothetical protein MZU79_04005 [Anaerotruncus sp.]|nr:hypothetical protein [Anaerotruncus sp.]
MNLYRRKNESFQNDRGRPRAALRRQRSRGIRAGGARGPGQETGTQARRPRLRMPKEIEAVIQEGLAARQGRQDMPFSFFKPLVLARPGPTTSTPSSTSRPRTAISATPPRLSGSGAMETNLNAFFQFFQADADRGAEVQVRAASPRCVLTTAGAGYSAREGGLVFVRH